MNTPKDYASIRKSVSHPLVRSVRFVQESKPYYLCINQQILTARYAVSLPNQYLLHFATAIYFAVSPQRHLLREKLYLSSILDLCSRDIVSYTISNRPVVYGDNNAKQGSEEVASKIQVDQFREELIDDLDYYNNCCIKAKREGLLSALHIQQALSAA